MGAPGVMAVWHSRYRGAGFPARCHAVRRASRRARARSQGPRGQRRHSMPWSCHSMYARACYWAWQQGHGRWSGARDGPCTGAGTRDRCGRRSCRVRSHRATAAAMSSIRVIIRQNSQPRPYRVDPSTVGVILLATTREERPFMRALNRTGRATLAIGAAAALVMSLSASNAQAATGTFFYTRADNGHETTLNVPTPNGNASPSAVAHVMRTTTRTPTPPCTRTATARSSPASSVPGTSSRSRLRSRPS